jgi:LCP family protein required for cell wall assembly
MQNFGADTTKDVIREITGIKVDKYVEFDFEAFTDIVDYLGGINVEVDKKLVDERYPTSDYGYKTVTFTPGIEKMNGERALEYARSRKSTNDFDRNLRQQKIILSLKNKIDGFNVIENIDFFLNAYNEVESHLQTDLNFLEGIQIYDQYRNYQINAGNILSSENYLYSSKSLTGQFILLPVKNTFLPFQQKLFEII